MSWRWERKPRRCLVAELISPRNRTPASRRAPASLHWSELPGSLAISATFKLPSFNFQVGCCPCTVWDSGLQRKIPLHPVGRARLQKPCKTDNAARYDQTGPTFSTTFTTHPNLLMLALRRSPTAAQFQQRDQAGVDETLRDTTPGSDPFLEAGWIPRTVYFHRPPRTTTSPRPLFRTPATLGKPRFPRQYAQTQQNVSASNFVQSDPARGFHETIWSDRMPNLAAMPSQESPHCT
jgi:hypothetical protein